MTFIDFIDSIDSKIIINLLRELKDLEKKNRARNQANLSIVNN